MEEKEKGILYIVSTPIGNLEDITFRAVRILEEVDIIAAEDTRVTRKLLARYEIRTLLRSYHQYNRFKQADKLLKLITEGRKIALVSNAGTPGISDPGCHLVNLALGKGVSVVPIPGPAALITAISASGFPGTNFIFYGWLSPKSGRRKNELRGLEGEERTLVFYESPHRLVRAMKDMEEILGDRFMVICRELTKKFEEILRGRISELIAVLEQGKVRGEFTLILRGCRKNLNTALP